MLYNVCDSSYLVNEPRIAFVEIPEIVNVGNLIAIPSLLPSIGSCCRWIEMNVPVLIIPFSIEEVNDSVNFRVFRL
jgi:hypothetical protein